MYGLFKAVVAGSKGFDDYALLEAYVDKKLSRATREDSIPPPFLPD